MAYTEAPHFGSIDNAELDHVIDSLKRERSLKLAGALGGLSLLVVALMALAYLNFTHRIDPGPPRAEPEMHPGQTGF